MITSDETIIPLEKSHEDRAIRVIIEAFTEDALERYILGKKKDDNKVREWYNGIAVKYGLLSRWWAVASLTRAL